MRQVQVYRAKPNPAGRDKSGPFPLPQQLLGEFVDIKNIGNEVVNTSILYLAHQQYDASCNPEKNCTVYWEGRNNPLALKPGEIARVHTGKRKDVLQMHPSDAAVANFHTYADQGYFVLNNDRCGDIISLWTKDAGGNWVRLDRARYDGPPPEGVTLIRWNEKLISPTFK